ncbi:guanine nucleotide exchange factor 10-like protein [Actinomortierella wolfii]|nr:guanine nucleotide exchange factor 10-like protein [Actinomortierella wolfii]
MPPSSSSNHQQICGSHQHYVDPTKTLPSLPSNQGRRNRDSIGIYLASKTTKSPPPKQPMTTILGSGFFKPLWQHTMITPEEIAKLGLTSQEIQRQETIFELIFTEKEYIEDLKTIQRIFVDDLKARYNESKKKRRFGTDKQDAILEEKLDRLLTHIHALWNGHQSLLNFLQQRQTKAKPVVEKIGDIFVNNFYMFPIYDSYFTQYGSVSKEFEHLRTGNSELVVLIRDLLELTPESNPDHAAIQEALEKHKHGLSKIDDQKWIQEHNEMLRDLQQRIKGLPPGFSLVEQYRYLVLDGPVYRVKSQHPKHDARSSTRDYFADPLYDGRAPFLIQQQPSLLKYHHQHRQLQPTSPTHSPTESSSSTSSESKQWGSNSTKHRPLSPTSSPPTSTTSSSSTPWYISLVKSAFGGGRSSKSAPPSSPSGQLSSSAPSSVSPLSLSSSTLTGSDMSAVSESVLPNIEETVMSSFNQHRHWRRYFDSQTSGPPPIPASIRNPDADAEYHVFVFTDIILWTKRITGRYQRKDGASWTFKLVEPVSRLTQVDLTEDDYIFHCTSVNSNSNSYFVRTEDDVAAKMWKSTIPSLVNFHCSRHQLDYGRKR